MRFSSYLSVSWFSKFLQSPCYNCLNNPFFRLPLQIRWLAFWHSPLAWLTLSAITYDASCKLPCCGDGFRICCETPVPSTVPSLLFIWVNTLSIITKPAISPVYSCFILSSPVFINVKAQLDVLQIHLSRLISASRFKITPSADQSGSYLGWFLVFLCPEI